MMPKKQRTRRGDVNRAPIPAGTIASYIRHQARHPFEIVHILCTKAGDYARGATRGHFEVALKLASLRGCCFGHT